MIRAAAAADSTPSPKMRCGQNILNKIYNKNSYFLLLLLPLSPSPSFFLFALIIILSFFFLPDHQGTKEISKLNSFIVWNCNIASTVFQRRKRRRILQDSSGGDALLFLLFLFLLFLFLFFLFLFLTDDLLHPSEQSVIRRSNVRRIWRVR